MKTLHNLMFAGILVCAVAGSANAQNADAAALVKQGIQLHDQGKYADAIEKYQQALKIEPTNNMAEFELSYSMYAGGRGSEAIPHLQKIIKDPSDTKLAAQASDILGSIYDDSQQPEKAIEAYQNGLKLDPQYQRLHYNLALALARQKRYAEAEASAIEAIKLDPKHASSQRIYAAALQGQGKDAFALMAYFNFLMLEPQTQRSVAAYAQVQAIIKSKYKVTGDKAMTIFVKDHQEGGDADMFALESGLSISIAAALDKKNASDVAILKDELDGLFGIAGELSAKKKDKGFFWKFYADYFYKLSQSGNMDAFTRLVSLTANQAETLQWFKDNPDKLKNLNNWAQVTERGF